MIPAYLHDSVSRRILRPLFALAAESCCSMPLLTDRKAVEISEIIRKISGKDILSKRDIVHYTLVLRALCFDRLINDFIWRHPSGTVINLGCGLDTSFERLAKGPSHWYDLDTPEVIGVRKLFLDETDGRTFITSTFLHTNWMDEIIYNDALLVFASGVFYYYPENTIRKFFARLISKFPSFEMIFNVTSPAGVRSANRFIKEAGKASEPLLNWGLSDRNSLAEWSPRIRIVGSYRIFNSSPAGIPLKCLLQGKLSDAMGIERILHLKIRYNYGKIR